MLIMFLLFLIIRRLPTSTLFPYTTLFRSGLLELAQEARRARPIRPDHIGHGATNVVRSNRTGSDRKSTRLNSSHTVNSYAVFCLKKKKEENLIIHYSHNHRYAHPYHASYT